MKKVTIFTAIGFLAILFVSCSKTSSDETSQGLSTSSLSTSGPKEINVVSNWMSPNSFAVNVDRLGGYSIIGSWLNSGSAQINYDEGTHVELAYARIQAHGRPTVYKKLAFGVRAEANGVAAHVLVDYSVDPDGLKIYFKEAAYGFLACAVDQSILEGWEYRYIIIPKTKYQSMQVDWDDLVAVAAALNFSL
jgi:hypothetical protein